jgi:site-specific recombinase XerD
MAIPDDQNQALEGTLVATPPQPAPLHIPTPILSLDSLIKAWLHEKSGRSNSTRTAASYEQVLAQFRATLQQVGLDLDREPTKITLVAQGWAAQTTRKSTIAPATYNQRLAILSSFYEYAIRMRHLAENPIHQVARRKVDVYGAATALNYLSLQRKLRAIDRTTPAGLRDYALLAVALHTGRRVSELASLRWADLHLVDDQVTLNFPRAKGGKAMRDVLPRAAAKALLAWLYAHYGAQLGDLSHDAPLWPSLSRQNRGKAMTGQAIADVCQRWLGVSKVHTLRHTFARAMEDAGAKVSEIQARLGHTSLATTGRYLAALRSGENIHGDKLSSLFGIDGE